MHLAILLQFLGSGLLVTVNCCKTGSVESETLDDNEIVTAESVNTKTTISRNPKTMKFVLYSSDSNSNDPSTKFCELIIGNLSSFKTCGFDSTQNSMILLIHGFLAQPMSLDPIRDAYLKSGFKNIVAVDWRQLVGAMIPPPIGLVSYIWAQKNVPRASKRTVEFLSFMLANGQLKDLGGVHLIGHSLGAHLAGSIGTLAQCNLTLQIGRITGIDPAGPFLSLQKPKDRLSPTAGTFVDAVHTDGWVQGTRKPLGHMDFYPNGGIPINQKVSDPRCVFEKKTPFYTIIYYTIGMPLICPHIIGIKYYAQTIAPTTNSVDKEPINKYPACPCEVENGRFPCPTFQPNCPNETIFGEYVDKSVRGKYYVNIELSD